MVRCARATKTPPQPSSRPDETMDEIIVVRRRTTAVAQTYARSRTPLYDYV
jgi:hypothetical protein